MRVHRPLGAICSVAALILAATGCSDPWVGQVAGSEGDASVVTVQDPKPGVCHLLAAGGVRGVSNGTGVDIVLHQGLDCKDPAGSAGFYLATNSTVRSSPSPWRSFSVVGWVPPIT